MRLDREASKLWERACELKARNVIPQACIGAEQFAVSVAHGAKTIGLALLIWREHLCVEEPRCLADDVSSNVTERTASAGAEASDGATGGSVERFDGRVTTSRHDRVHVGRSGQVRPSIDEGLHRQLDRAGRSTISPHLDSRDVGVPVPRQ
jgi:hypothetical protein